MNRTITNVMVTSSIKEQREYDTAPRDAPGHRAARRRHDLPSARLGQTPTRPELASSPA